jgi:hypothetical protein
MQCPICAALHRDHSLECELEAKMILHQRSQLLSRGPGSAVSKDSEDLVLSSRKRQIQITSKIERHKAKGHAA